MYYDTELNKNILYKLNYYVTQLTTISADNGTKIEAGAKQQSGSEVNAVVDSFKADTYTSKAGNKMDYRLYEPKTEKGKKYPLVIFLHGNGERGANGVTQLIGNAGGTVWASDENQAKNPSFILAPQNPLLLSGLWLEKSVYETTLELIKSAASNPLIDTNRIYLTGVSQGGFGTWGFIQRNPDLFAAAMPVCGGGDLTKVEAVKDLPIWAFHAADDPVVKVSGEIPLYMPEFMIHGTRDMVNALRALGDTKVKYTEYEPGYVAMPLAPMAHFSWVPAYKTQEAIDWMFKQSK
jgi:predicted peptidase